MRRLYKVLTATKVEDLERKVDKLCLSGGWLPIGGLSYNESRKVYSQALFNYDEKNKPQPKEEQSDESLEEAHLLGPNLAEVFGGKWKAAKWDEEFRNIVVNEFSRPASLFINKNHIRSVKLLFAKMKQKEFETSVTKEILVELNAFIEKYNWKDE